MTQTDIIEIATKVWGKCDWHESALCHLEAFAKLVYDRGWMNGYTSCDNDNKELTSALIDDAVEDEREECAKLVEGSGEKMSDKNWDSEYEAFAEYAARTIRARGKQK
jgi:hypothetical protein